MAKNLKQKTGPSVTAKREQVENLMAAWDSIRMRMVAINEIATHDELQPRDPLAIKGAIVRNEHQRRREELVETLYQHLRDCPAKEAVPLWVAETEDGLFVVDGHHRLEAYLAAKRNTIPVRIKRVSFRTAVMVSRLVNVRGSTVALHSDEVRETAWLFVSELMRFGDDAWDVPKAKGYSYGVVRELFGCQLTKDTIRRMIDTVPEVRPMGHPSEDWPTWRDVLKQKREGAGVIKPHDLDEEIDKLVLELLPLFQRHSGAAIPAAYRKTLQLMDKAAAERHSNKVRLDEEDIY